jgi:MFS family permease
MIVPFTVLPTVTTRTLDRVRADMHFKPRLVIGQILAVAGTATLALSVWRPALSVILLGLALLGVALGYITPAMTTGVLTASPPAMSGLASGTLMQMHHERGMVVSFAVAMALFAVIALWASRAIPEPLR